LGSQTIGGFEMEIITRTCKEWEELMKDKPCYAPCPPFFDMCNTLVGVDSGKDLKHLDCDECCTKRGIKDYIE